MPSASSHDFTPWSWTYLRRVRRLAPPGAPDPRGRRVRPADQRRRIGLVCRRGDEVVGRVPGDASSLAAAADVDDVLRRNGILLIVCCHVPGAREADDPELAPVADLLGADLRRRGHVECPARRQRPTEQDAVTLGQHEPGPARDEQPLDEEPPPHLLRCQEDELVAVGRHSHVGAHLGTPPSFVRAAEKPSHVAETVENYAPTATMPPESRQVPRGVRSGTCRSPRHVPPARKPDRIRTAADPFADTRGRDSMA